MKQEGNVSRSLTWRVLSVLVAILLTVSGVSSATASGKIAPAFQEGNPPEQESTVFQIEGNDTNSIAPSNEVTISSTLYDQFDGLALTAAISQDYGDTTNIMDTEVADDFVVPATDGVWDLRSIELYGACDTGYCSVFTVNVNIYAGDGILPGQLVYSARNQTVQLGYTLYGTTIKQYIIDLPTPAYLAPGRYWVSVQANMNAASGNWGWLERSIQTGNWHAFRNPGGGWREGCLTWCSGHPKYPDLMFRLFGYSSGIYKVKVGINYYDAGQSMVEHGTKPLLYASIHYTHSVAVINTDTGNIEATIPVGLFPDGLAISPDSSEVYVARQDGIDVISTDTNTVIRSFSFWLYPKLVYGGLGRLFVSNIDGITIINPSTGETVNAIAMPLQTIFSISQDGDTLCTSAGGSPSSINCFDVRTDNPPQAWTNSNACNDLTNLEISGDGTKVYALCEGDIKIFAMSTLEQTGQFNSGILLETAHSTPDGQVVIGADNAKSWIINEQTHQPIRILDSVPVKIIQVGGNSRSAYAVTYKPYDQQFLYIYKFSYFSDIYWSHWARTWIERLYNAGVTGGCGTSPLIYCPDESVTRAQMAVFIERGKNGSSYTPPAATGTTFGDVASNHWAAAWIEQLAADGITGGCSGGNYCPETVVTRDQMAVFLLRAMHGSTYAPPTPTGIFADVPTTHWAAAWIEQLAAEGITSGCGGGNYCPDTPVTRAQMAVFLVKAFNLP